MSPTPQSGPRTTRSPLASGGSALRSTRASAAAWCGAAASAAALHAALGASSAITLLVGAALGAPADRSPVRHALHVAVGGGCLLVVGACAWKFEPELLEAISTARSKGE